MHTIFIEGENINLCVIDDEYIEGNYQAWLNDEIVCSGNSHYRYPTTKNSLIEYIHNINNSSLVLAIIEKATNTHIGNASLQKIDYINSTAEFAIVIGEKTAWGKGYGKEVAYYMIKHGFTHLNLNRIYCGTFENNLGMLKIAERLNMTREGVRRKAVYKNGRYLDVIEFGLLKCEFDEITY